MAVVISNMRYADASNTTIDMDVAGWIEGETIPFTYHPDDTEPTSQAVKELLANKNYGIAPYVPPVVPVTVPTSASKLGLKRAFTELGQWDNVKAYLAANPDLQEDWDLAIEIKRSDSLTQGAVTALNLSSDQVDSLLVRANELVA
ncbi:MAG: hypothetical protein J0G33_02675 [Afipia felis]|nr:hypothetical protein [Afipia felis]